MKQNSKTQIYNLAEGISLEAIANFAKFLISRMLNFKYNYEEGTITVEGIVPIDEKRINEFLEGSWNCFNLITKA